MDASIRQFCASARARFEACADFDTKRQFLLGHVERVIYNRYKVTIAGSVPVQSASGETKLQFRIEGEIDQKAVRSRPRTLRSEDGRKEPILTSFSRSVDHYPQMLPILEPFSRGSVVRRIEQVQPGAGGAAPIASCERG